MQIIPPSKSALTELGSINFCIIREGVCIAGSFDPDVIFPYFEESLAANDIETIYSFLKWVSADVNNRRYGFDNYEQRFAEWLNYEEPADSNLNAWGSGVNVVERLIHSIKSEFPHLSADPDSVQYLWIKDLEGLIK